MRGTRNSLHAPRKAKSPTTYEPSPIIFFLKLRYEANQVVQWGCGQAADLVGCAVVDVQSVFDHRALGEYDKDGHGTELFGRAGQHALDEPLLEGQKEDQRWQHGDGCASIHTAIVHPPGRDEAQERGRHDL